VRRIKPSQIVVFAVLLGVALILSVVTAWASLGQVPLGDFRGVVLTLLGVILLYVYSILFYRLFLKVFPAARGGNRG
jgi:hypothetical protein